MEIILQFKEDDVPKPRTDHRPNYREEHEFIEVFFGWYNCVFDSQIHLPIPNLPEGPRRDDPGG
jgi:hypothetical protein